MEIPNRPCRICKQPVDAYKRKDGRGYTYRRQCGNCRNKPRNESAWRKNMSEARKGCKNPCYVKEGTRVQSKHGERVYWKIKTSEGKWVYEHRFLMEKKLGRKIGRLEQIHHINNNSQDNSMDNLELLSPKQHVERTYPGCHVNLKCFHCGKEFIRNKSNIKYVKNYCSRKCFRK